MNIPKIILNNRKILSPDVINYYQSIAQRLILKRKNSEDIIIANYSKDKILNWFRNIDIKDKFKICSIYNNWFSNIIFQLKEYSKLVSVIEFCPTDLYSDFNKGNENEYIILKNELNSKNIKIQNYDNFSNFFKVENKAKKAIGIIEDHELINLNYKNHTENLFLSELRFITLDEFNDTITFSHNLFNKPDRLFEFFYYFSKNQCFGTIINPIQEKNNCYNFSFPNWIYKYPSYSFCQLLVIFFEQIISVYYQLFLLENNIPKFVIDKKYNEFFKTNDNIKEYLLQKNNNDLIDKQKILDILDTDKYKEKFFYYCTKSNMVHISAFGAISDEIEIDTQKEFKIRYEELNELIKNNKINEIVDKISLIEARFAFKYSNFIFLVVYQQLLEKYSYQCTQELLKEEKNKIDCEITNKTNTKKNKRKRKKKKKNEKEKNKINDDNIVTNNINDNSEKYNSEKKDDIILDNDEEIEEIPANFISNSNQDLNEFDSKNNIQSNNDINNSTVSSSHTNKYSKDYNFGPRYNNFIKCEKKEILLEIKDFIDEKKEESEEEKEKNDNNFELEDISENDISDENKHNQDLNTSINNSENKKKKKKHRKRNKKKNKNIETEKKDENLNIENKNNNIKENKNNKIKINNNENKKIDFPKIAINNKKDYIQKEIEKKEYNNSNNKNSQKEELEKIKIIQNNNLKSESKNINQCKEEKIKKEIERKIEIKKEENERHKKKNNKDFFLFPVYTNKKEKKNNINISEKKNFKAELKCESNLTLSKINNEEKSKNKDSNFEIKNVENITINPTKKNNNYYYSNYIDNNFNSLFFLSHPNYSNINLSKNNSFLASQNELFSSLGKDILLFKQNIELNLKDLNVYRELIINKFIVFIKDILSKKYIIEFLFYGSYSTGLSIETSDVDILIKFEKKEKKEQSNIQENLHNIIVYLDKEFNKNVDILKINKINPIYTASIPVLKIECLLKDIIPSNIINQISKRYIFNLEEILKLNFDFTFLEVENIKKEIVIPSQKIIIFIKNIISKYPILKPIILVLKRYLQIRKLNSSFQGGISSFSLFLLVSSYIKQVFYENKYLEKDLNSENLIGKLLYGFFLFYGNFNFKIHSIDLTKDRPFILLNEIIDSNILLIDPITKLNVAKSTFRIDKIKNAFNNAIMILNENFFNNMNYIHDEGTNLLEKLLTIYYPNNYFY